MLKYYKNLTTTDKHRILEASKVEVEQNGGGIPWSTMEQRTQTFLDCTFDDKRFPEISPDDHIDVVFCRKEAGKKEAGAGGFLYLVVQFLSSFGSGGGAG